MNDKIITTFWDYNDFINYRNQVIGYVFQDFHLIDELTVEENKIEIFYEHYLDDKWQSSNKLKIIF